MTRPKLILVLLLAICFTLTIRLQPLQEARQTRSTPSGNVLALLLGDARKMFAQQMFAKADAYFHRGNYPSIFDQTPREENHMASETHHDEHGDGDHDEDRADEPAPANDWIEGFGRHFYPTVHVHLKEGEEREMLPWLRMASELDPHNIDTYVVTAYWMRDRLHKVDEAEQLLREGLRENPDSPELLYELGRLFFENRKDFSRARNVWLFALRRWNEIEPSQPEPDKILLAQIIGGLARVEMQEGRQREAIQYLKQLQDRSPHPEQIQKQIDSLSAPIKNSP